MFRGRILQGQGLAVWLFTSGPNTEADWRSYCDAIVTASRLGAAHPCPCALQVIDRGSVDPGAKTRRQIADATAAASPRSHLVLVTSSAMVRHVLTAIAWLRPPVFTLHTRATEEEGFATLEGLRPGSEAILRPVLDALRSEGEP